jgi:HTH-like domain
VPLYGYRRVHAILRRRALAEGRQPPSHKRVYRVMKEQIAWQHAAVRSDRGYHLGLCDPAPVRVTEPIREA